MATEGGVHISRGIKTVDPSSLVVNSLSVKFHISGMERPAVTRNPMQIKRLMAERMLDRETSTILRREHCEFV